RREPEGYVVLAASRGPRATQALFVGLCDLVEVHPLVGGDHVLGVVVVALFSLVQEGGGDRVTQAEHAVGRVVRGVHGRDAGRHLLGGGVDVLGVEVEVVEHLPVAAQPVDLG